MAPQGNAMGGIVKSATNLIAQVPGGERLVLQAVRDMMNELRDLRRTNMRLVKENERLKERLDKLSARPARR